MATTKNFTTIDNEELRRLRVEAAAGRGLRIEFYSKAGGGWLPKRDSVWYWATLDYRVAEPVAGKRTRSELLKQLNDLNAELQALEAQP